MKKEAEACRNFRGKPIRAELYRIGEDYLAVIAGGDKAHAGSLSAALPYESPNGGKRSATVSTYVFPEHKDDRIGNRFAKELALVTGRHTAAVCGVHYDGLNRKEIEEILALGEELLAELCAKAAGENTADERVADESADGKSTAGESAAANDAAGERTGKRISGR